MPLSPRVLCLAALLVSFPMLAQQTEPSAPSAATQAATQDPQAVTIVNQAINAAGGAMAISGVSDYTATGNITYNWPKNNQGTVTVQALGDVEVRIDANLPNGIRSWAIQGGQSTTKSPEGVITQMPSTLAAVPSANAYPYEAPLFPSSLLLPHLQLPAVIGNPGYGIHYVGVVQLNGQSVYDIRIHWFPVSFTAKDAMAEYHTKDIYINTTTLQVVMTQDCLPKHVIHQLWYSNYTTTNGVSVPFSITENMGGTQTWTIQLSQITFNSGLPNRIPIPAAFITTLRINWVRRAW